MSLQCLGCKAQNPDNNRFCGNCGGPLDPASDTIRLFVNSAIRDQTDEIIAQKYKDQKLIELETAQAIVARISEWTKLFAFFCAVPLAVLLVLFGVLGFNSYTDFTSKVAKAQTEVLGRFAEVQKNADELLLAVNAQRGAQKSVADQQNTLASGTLELDRQFKVLRLKVQEIYGGNIDNPDTTGGSLINLAKSGQGIQSNVDELAKRIAALEGNGHGAELSARALDNLTGSLRVRQTSSPVQDDSADRKNYDLSFSLCVQIADKCEEEGLDSVEKVVYRLDPKWFTDATETRINRADRFNYGVRVWGVTQVTACIYLKGRPDQPIVRADRMSLSDPRFWGPRLSVVPDDCAAPPPLPN